MSNKNLALNDQLYQYLLAVSLRVDPILRQLRDETVAMPQAGMQIAPEQGQFMALLVKLMGATRILEVGVFTGYSSTVMALALPPQGRLVACDNSAAWTAVAQRYWRQAGVSERIDLRLGPAVETLHTLLREGLAETFDMAFIDADKVNYAAYYEACLQLLRPGGLVLIDNALWGGRVVDAHAQDADTQAIRALNQKLLGDTRVEISLLPVADGLTLAVKRSLS